MSRYIHADRPLTLDTPLGPDVLLPIKISGVEAMSTPYRFKLVMLAEEAVDFDRLVGAEATLRLATPGGGKRVIHGILRRLKEGRRVSGPNGPSTFLRYQAELVAPVWRLSRRVQSRVFRHDGQLKNSVPEILRQVLLDEWRLRVTFRLSGQYPPRDHAVQYRESDLAFVTRLMEEEGIYYYFNQDDHGCEMVVTDGPIGCVPAGDAIAFDDVRGGTRPGERIHDWKKEQEVRAVRHTLRDYSFHMPQSWLEGQQAMLVPERVAVGRVDHLLNRGHSIDGTEMLEVYDFPGGYAHRFDGVGAGGEDQGANLESLSTDKDRTVRLRMQEEAARCLKVTGRGDVAAFTPGHAFRLASHPSGDGIYLLTRVEHAATQPIDPSSEVKPSYSNTFACLPEGLPYRPRRKTPRPRIDGTQTAVVVGPHGAKTFVDRFGRIKVHFHWDRNGKKDANSSCWVRVAQTWAGYRIGAFFWPRVGDEVVVSFEEGDPDRPMVVGSVYNARNMPPFELPGSALTAGFKSGSIGGDPLKDFNGVLLYDEPGKECVFIHGEKGTMISDEAERNVRVGRYQRTVIGGPSLVPPLGSGSGGGEDKGHDDKDHDKKDHDDKDEGGHEKWEPKFQWDGHDFKHAWASHVEYAYGHHLDVSVGIHAASHMGAHVDLTCNPVGLVELLDVSPPSVLVQKGLWNACTAGMNVLGGHTDFTIGSSTHGGFGPSLEMHHGCKIESHGALSGDHAMVAGGVIRNCVLLANLGQGLLAACPWLPDGSGRNAQYVFETIIGLILTRVVFLEKTEALADLAHAETNEAAILRGQAVALQVHNPDPDTLRAFANTILRRVNEVQQDLTAARGQLRAEMNRAAKVVPDNYQLTAHDITMLSRRDNGPTSVSISALGRVDDLGQGTGGALNLNCTGTMNLACASQAGATSTLLFQGTPNALLNPFGICMDSSAPIRIRHGDQLMTSPRLELQSPNVRIIAGGATETAGPRLVMKAATATAPTQVISLGVSPDDAAPGPHIKIESTAAGRTITIASGGAADPKIVVSNQGIRLVGGADVTAELGAVSGGNIVLTKGGRTLTVSTTNVTVA